MGRTEDLEAALRADWNDDALSVYADHLQALGDPRGELIALDLEGDDGEDATARRGELLRAWVGPDFETWCSPNDHRWYAGDRAAGIWILPQFGLLEVVDAGEGDAARVEAFLASPASTFVHRCSFAGEANRLRRLVGAFTATERTWLRALGLRRLDRTGDECLDGWRLGQAFPNLTHLDLAGRRVLDHLELPTVTTLVVTGEHALSLESGPPLASITTLDFAFEPDTVRAGIHNYVRRERLPNVRRLGLSRQEPNAPLDLPKLSELDLANQLVRLELPALRSDADVIAVELAADRMPNLRELVIARAYMCFGDHRIELARARVRHPVAWRGRGHRSTRSTGSGSPRPVRTRTRTC